MKNIKPFLIALVCVVLFCACKKTEDDPAPSSTISKEAVVGNYAILVHATYQDAYTQALSLKAKANTFLADPSESKFTELKNAYLAARVPYEQSEAFRFYDGPIDDANGPEGLLNSWPLDELFIDYVDGQPTSGIINNAVDYPAIDKALIENENGNGGDANVSSGYHAIEFLLWGQDLSDLGPGARPYTDYLTTGGTASNQARRKQYLTAAIDLLIDNLSYLVDAWAPNRANFRADFVKNPNTALAQIISGAGKYAKGELAGERMTVALNSQDKEDEHSCFSDDTHHDIVYGNQSIINVYTCHYVRTNGTIIAGSSISDLVKASNAKVDEEMSTLLDDAENKALMIHPPFDQEIAGTNAAGRTRVQNTIDAIKAEGNKWVQVASTIGISLTIPDTNN
ncbi:MAG: imelysin [Cytophagaceae bacterium]|nr:imelysin [Cytophagaceae bacterium]